MKLSFFPSSIDSDYAEAESRLVARTPGQKARTILDYLLPGIAVFLLINTVLHDWLVTVTGLDSRTYQFWVLIGLTFGWHIAYPIWVLRHQEKMSWPEVWSTLSLHRFSAKGFFLITPVFFLALLIVAVPYMHFVFPPLHDWLQSISALNIPEHSIFHDYTTIYSFAPWQLALLFVGNFLGEEIYFRGYLLKRSAFLGTNNWWIHSLLFSAYHLWQIPMTYALSFISLAFGFWMLRRRNLWELMLLHVLINLFLPVVVQLIYG